MSVKSMKPWADHIAAALPRLRQLQKDKQTEAVDAAILLVEPRKHPNTEFVIRNLTHFLPGWRLIIVHGDKNEEFMRSITEGMTHVEISFLSCRAADLPNPDYNTLFTMKQFWDSVPYERLLIAQTDTMLMQDARQFLDSLSVSFCGAPWSYQCSLCAAPLDGGCGHMIDQKVVASIPGMVGNGGLSFRKKSAMLAALDKYQLGVPGNDSLRKKWGAAMPTTEKIAGTSNEDVFFCKAFSLMGEPIADRATALQFAIEQIPPFEWKAGPLAIGLHKPWGYMPEKLVEAILSRVVY